MEHYWIIVNTVNYILQGFDIIDKSFLFKKSTLVKAFSFVIDDPMLAFIYEVHRLSRYFQLTVVFNAVIPAPAEVLHAFISVNVCNTHIHNILNIFFIDHFCIFISVFSLCLHVSINV